MAVQGRAAIVTGGGRGLGAAMARALAREGASVLVGDIDADAAHATAEALRASGGDAEAVAADVADPAAAEALTRAALQRFGRVGVLVNNAGVGLNKMFMETTPDDLDRVMRVNVTGPLLCAQAALRVMLPRGYGRVINVVSISGFVGNIGRTAY